MMSRILRTIGWVYVAACLAFIALMRLMPAEADAADDPQPEPVRTLRAVSAAEWFRQIKSFCNPVEIAVALRRSPPPSGVEGAGFGAACHALAGEIDEARRMINTLDGRERYRAAGIVFNVGHPIADAGDDRSAGPLMELVIDYWPNHYMALYHAGMAEFSLGQHARATQNLDAFLRLYRDNDGWRSSAIATLGKLRSAAGTAPAETR